MRLFMQHGRCSSRAAAQPELRAAWVAALALVLASPAVLPAQDTTHTAPDSVAAATPVAAADSLAAADTLAAGDSLAARDTLAVATAAADTTAGSSHTVREGDTLWDLAGFYLGDPFLWPEIYRINTSIVEDPHWIFPGEVLRVPGRARLAAMDETIPRLQPEPVPSSGGPTVFADFMVRQRVGSSQRSATAATYQHTVVSPGDFYAAPWVQRSGALRDQGHIVASAVLPGIAHASNRLRVHTQERVYIALPEGMAVSEGDRLLVVESGPNLVDDAQVVIPTGILEVVRAGNGEAPTARVAQMFGDLKIGQAIIPLDRFSMDPAARPVPLEGGTECKVIAVPSEVVLPTVGYYVILSATATDGVKLGDQFTLYRPRKSVPLPADDDRSVTLPEEEIALAQVVKVTDLGTTALVVSQRHPVIRTGVNARLTARMP